MNLTLTKTWSKVFALAAVTVTATGCPFSIMHTNSAGKESAVAIDPDGSIGVNTDVSNFALKIRGYWEIADSAVTFECLALDNTRKTMATIDMEDTGYELNLAANPAAVAVLRDQCGTFYDSARAKNYKVITVRIGTMYAPVMTSKNFSCMATELGRTDGDVPTATNNCLAQDTRDGASSNWGANRTPRDVNKLKVYLPTPAPVPSGKVSGLTAAQLGLVINDNDPYSVEVGEYYRVKRNIPTANIVHVRVPTVVQLNRTQFAALKAQVDAAFGPQIQALAVAWTSPSRVECNSLTSAMARGFDAPACDSRLMMSSASPYYNTGSTKPFTDFGVRPAMQLAAKSIEDGKALINRGVASDGTKPRARAHIMKTSDSTRSLRAIRYPAANLGLALSPYVNVTVDSAEAITGTTDTMFYVQGLQSVSGIATNAFPPGAVADHLTSFGGMLTDPFAPQMSCLDFIAGGATGTFGTVVEPFAIAEKFPNPSILISHYTAGETLIEAYWKSVSQTFQGAFVGEPLANPWRVVTP